jgi:phage gp29-like protein
MRIAPSTRKGEDRGVNQRLEIGMIHPERWVEAKSEVETVFSNDCVQRQRDTGSATLITTVSTSRKSHSKAEGKICSFTRTSHANPLIEFNST